MQVAKAFSRAAPARRPDPDQARRRCARRRRAHGEGGHRRSDPLHRHRRGPRPTRAVPSGGPRLAHPRDGRRRRPGPRFRAGRRPGRGRAGRRAPAHGPLRPRGPAQAAPDDPEAGAAARGLREAADVRLARGAGRRARARQGRGADPLDDPRRAGAARDHRQEPGRAHRARQRPALEGGARAGRALRADARDDVGGRRARRRAALADSGTRARRGRTRSVGAARAGGRRRRACRRASRRARARGRRTSAARPGALARRTDGDRRRTRGARLGRWRSRGRWTASEGRRAAVRLGAPRGPTRSSGVRTVRFGRLRCRSVSHPCCASSFPSLAALGLLAGLEAAADAAAAAAGPRAERPLLDARLHRGRHPRRPDPRQRAPRRRVRDAELPAGLSARERERRVEQAKRRYAAILLQLASGQRSGLSAEAERVLALWPAGTSERDAARRRSQRALPARAGRQVPRGSDPRQPVARAHRARARRGGRAARARRAAPRRVFVQSARLFARRRGRPVAVHALDRPPLHARRRRGRRAHGSAQGERRRRAPARIQLPPDRILAARDHRLQPRRWPAWCAPRARSARATSRRSSRATRAAASASRRETSTPSSSPPPRSIASPSASSAALETLPAIEYEVVELDHFYRIAQPAARARRRSRGAARAQPGAASARVERREVRAARLRAARAEAPR